VKAARAGVSKRERSKTVGNQLVIVYGEIDTKYPSSTMTRITSRLVDDVEALTTFAGQPRENRQNKKSYNGRRLRVRHIGRIRRIFDTVHLARYGSR
jgi:hypothetical protein